MVLLKRFTMVGAMLTACVALHNIGRAADDLEARGTAPATPTATLTGRFVFDGNPPPLNDLFPALSIIDPARPRLPGAGEQFDGVESVYRDFLAHGIQPKTEDASLLIGKQGGVANVVVWATSKNIPWKAPNDLGKRPVTIKLTSGNYSPRVAIAVVGQPVSVENHDPVGFHFRVEPFNPRNMSVNQLLKANSADTPLRLTWEQAEPRPTKFESNLGPWATGWLFVHANSFVAVSGVDGSFVIPDLPPGEWEFRAWHERAGYLKLWPNGKFKQSMKTGANTLGAIKLKPELFGDEDGSVNSQPPEGVLLPLEVPGKPPGVKRG